DNTVSVWGRRHHFSSDSPFPEQIISQGRELLAGRPRLVVESDAPLTWERGAIERQPNRARFEARGRAGALEARAEVTLAYEGLNRFVITLDPREPIALRSAVLEIPVRREHVNLISLYGAGNRSDAWRHQSPGQRAEEGGRGPVSENVMFNDMDTGLSWFLATPRGDWPVRDREQMMEIVPQDDTVLLRVWIADRPVELTEPIRIDMALLALPVMPRPEDPITWYIGQVGGVDSVEEYQEFVNIHYPAYGHVAPDGFLLDLWVRPTGPETGALVAFDDGAHWIALTGAGEEWVFRSGDPSGEQRPLRFGNARWTPGEWTHLRVHWQGLGTTQQQLTLWQDGAPAGQTETDAVEVDLYAARMVLGGLHNRIRSHFDLDAVRIERGIESGGTVATEQPVLTERTVLLDTFREPVQQNSIFDTRAERISGLSAETGGVPHFLSTYLPGRWGHALSLDWEQEHLLLDIMERFGYRGFYAGEGGYWDRWGRWEISDPERLAQCRFISREATRRGMTFMHYFCNYISPLDEENFALRAEMEKLPPQPFRHTTMLNVRRPAQDYVVWQLEDVMQRFGITGLHLDFHAGYFPDRNELAGSGWRDAAGQLHPTWDYYEVWTQQRRIYALCREAPLTDGVIMTHAGPSSLPWTTYKMSGEGSRTMESLLPLDAYRSGSTMGPTGIPKQFDTKHHHDNHNEIMAVTLLHNDPARIWSGMMNRHWTRRPTLADPYARNARPQCLLMAVRRRFDMATADFLPYWNEVPVRAVPAGPVISLWRHAGQRSLLVVSNLTREPAPNVTLDLDIEALGLKPGQFAAFDGYTRRNLSVDGSRVTVDIGAANYRLVWLEHCSATPPATAARTE
ncbi:MAG: LamG domain-containing protein, partial [Candidatus Marinimicrobia bacterium]|nr:LamG domain-containing protein [Candidatus Neomarinimicrobiota bacterium]